MSIRSEVLIGFMSIGSQIKKNVRQILFSTAHVAPEGIGEYLPLSLKQDMVLTQSFVPDRSGLLAFLLSFDSVSGFEQKESVELELEIRDSSTRKIVFKTRLDGNSINRFTRTEISLASVFFWPERLYELRLKVVQLGQDTDLIIQTVQKGDSELAIDSRATGLSLVIVQTYASFNTLPLLAAFLLLTAAIYLLFFSVSHVASIFAAFPFIPVLLAPLMTLIIVELLNTLNEKFWLPAKTFFLSYIIVLLFQILLAGVFNYFLPAIFVTLLLSAMLSLANHFKQFFRGDPLFAADIASAGMVMKTRGQLLYEIQLRFLLAFFSILVFIGLFRNVEPAQLETSLRLAFIAGSLLVNAVLAYLILFNNKWTSRHLDIGTRPWNPMNDYRCGGFVIPFYRSIRDLFIFSPQKSSRIPKDLYIVPDAAETSTQMQPDIIVIMNESFCDFRNIRDFAVSEPVMPFYDSLQADKNIIRGNLLVPVFGGGTSNTEFEYLTGSSMFYFNEASVPYLNYFRRPVHGLPDLLKQQGYSCQAIHPYMKSFYNRNSVYPQLGFDSFLTMEKFPKENLAGKFISDQADYEMILRQLQNRVDDQPYFIFSVTMQNHFPYHGTEENHAKLNYHIRLPDIVNSEGVEYFLSKLRESDEAIKYLIGKLKAVKKPTLLVFFGDHLPGNNSSFNNFYAELFGKPMADMDFAQTRKMFETPYFIWANYELPDLNVPLTSGNFLSLMTLDLAGNKRSAYYDFLADLNTSVIAMGSKFIVTKDGTYDLNNIPDDYSKMLNRYWTYQYDNIIRHLVKKRPKHSD